MSKSKKLKGGQVAVQALKKERTKHVFGLIGSATMEIFDALYHEKDIKFIGVRDERTGTHMADGYARASNQPGVILAGQNGPGATNLVTGIAQAAAAFSPVISIAGFISTKDKIKDAFQGVDQQSLFKPITKKTWMISKVKKIPKIFSQAFSLAMSPSRGPVQLNLPRNILSETARIDEYTGIDLPNNIVGSGKIDVLNAIAQSEDLLTSIDDHPSEFVVKSIFPNPFNPSTTIDYYLPRSSNLSISIFDVRGKLVNNIYNEFTQKGQHSIRWEANNHSSGLYFVIIEYENEITTNKIILLK